VTFRLRELATYSFACNVGASDRVLRILVGTALVVAAVALLDRFALQVLAAVIGSVIALTGVVSRCGMYYLFGLSTRRRAADPQ
jgi:hypothetical protein